MSRPNHSPELERKVLISLMDLDNPKDSRVQKAFLKLTSDVFFDSLHAEIFILIRNCFENQKNFNVFEILALIPKNNNELYMMQKDLMGELTTLHASSNSLTHDVDRIILFKTLRDQIKITKAMLDEIENIADPSDAQKCLINCVDEISSMSFQESKGGIRNTKITEKYLANDLEKDIIIPTANSTINKVFGGGIMSKSLITLAANAGVGKTGNAIWFLDIIARVQPGRQSLFFSLEMESRHIWTRHVGICGRKQFDKMDEQERFDAIARAMDIDLKIYDTATTPRCSEIDYIITTARLEAMQKPLSVIVVDYFGLVENKGNFERNDLRQSDITNRLAKLAMELNCVVIGLSQVNRSSANRAKDDQCPYPSDAADSSGSHRSSTLWIGLDRPELYSEETWVKDLFIMKTRKNRFGGNPEIKLIFNGGTFLDPPEGYFKKPFSESKNTDKSIFS